MDKLEKVLNDLGFLQYRELPIVKKVCNKTKIPPPVLITLILLLVVGLIFVPYVNEVITSLLVFFIPAFESFKALKTKETEDDDRMLTYWIVFGCLFAFDNTFRYLFSFIGFFSVIRLVVLLLLFSTKANGARLLYNRVISPFFERFGPHIESLMKPLEDHGRRVSRYIENQKDQLNKIREMQKKGNYSEMSEEREDDGKEKTE